MIASNLPALIVATPLIMSAIVALLPSGAWAWVVTLLTSLAVMVLRLCTAWLAMVGLSVMPWGLATTMGIEFISDGASRLMVLLAGLSFASTLYAKALIEMEIHPKDQARTYGAWLLTIGVTWVSNDGRCV